MRIAQDDLEAAAEYCRRLDEATARYGSHTWVALASQSKGELAATRGDIEAAKRYYAEAQAGFRDAKNEYAAAQCQKALTQLQSLK
jgi:ATP/maltotriose-dependent transcriptional regulator MalT